MRAIIINGEAKYLLPPEVQLPEQVAMGLEVRNIKEFSNLAKILPSVHFRIIFVVVSEYI